MGDLISRKAAIDIMQARGDASMGTVKAVFYSAAHMLELLPVVEAEPVRHGQWIKRGYVCGEYEWECSVCGESEWRGSTIGLYYCPNCGAKMDGDEKNV